jgi:tol-pal system-associated acyl-CoA thioesterase
LQRLREPQGRYFTDQVIEGGKVTTEYPLRVYIEDTDAGGIVYYVNYLKFMERARTEFLRQAGFQQRQLMQERDTLFVVHSLSVRFAIPARMDDELTVCSAVSEHGKTWLTFTQSVYRKHDRQLLCDAEVKVACINGKHRPIRIPAEILTALLSD